MHVNKFKAHIVFPEWSTVKLDINNRKIAGKFLNIWNLNDILIYNPWVKEAVLKENVKYFKLNKSENTNYKVLWDALRQCLEENLCH